MYISWGLANIDAHATLQCDSCIRPYWTILIVAVIINLFAPAPAPASAPAPAKADALSISFGLYSYYPDRPDDD